MKRLGKVFVVSEIFFPDSTSTGYYLTEIARVLTKEYSVTAICSRPPDGNGQEGSERHDGISIIRVGRMSKGGVSLTNRLVSAGWRSMAIGVQLLASCKRDDVLIVVTNPPILPYVVALVSMIRRCKMVLLVHDVYPQAAAAAGLLRADSFVYRLWEAIQRRLYRAAHQIIVLGRDMQELVMSQGILSGQKIKIICHWAEFRAVGASRKKRFDFGRADRVFTLLYAGNLGRTHDKKMLLEVIELGRSALNVRFHFAVSESAAALLRSEISDRHLENVSVSVLHRERCMQGETLALGDASLITFKKGMTGVSVPSRMYNAMAAGLPLIAAADEESELGRIISEEGVGWLSKPGDAKALWSAICEAAGNEPMRTEMGIRARCTAESRFSMEIILAQYAETVREVMD
jgi:colanic acid biosynthesis glycosyl transferase WcaI